MRVAKRLTLGTAATLLALTAAQAADLPVKAKPIEYVRVCSLYGAGFYYIPGTDTCIRIGGAIRLDTAFNAAPGYDTPFWRGTAGGANAYNRSYFSSYDRFNLFIDTRTATDYGVVRTYANLELDFGVGRDNIAGGFIRNGLGVHPVRRLHIRQGRVDVRSSVGARQAVDHIGDQRRIQRRNRHPDAGLYGFFRKRRFGDDRA